MTSDPIHIEPVLDHGYVRLRNIAGPTRRGTLEFDADDTDPANAARMSFDQTDSGRTRADDLKLCRYLMKNRHSTPFEMVECWFEMQIPICIARQFVRHRTARRFEFEQIDEMNDPSINEMSGRYVELPELFYIPDPRVVGSKSKSNKQGRTIDEGADNLIAAQRFARNLEISSREGFALYRDALADGVPNELARMHLLPNTYTRWLWKQDLHNVLHLMSLRIDGHAQHEAQRYALAMRTLLERALPETIRLFDEIYMHREHA